MSLKDELGLLKPVANRAHETVLNIVFTATIMGKEANRILCPLGLTDAQFNVLMLLGYQAAGGGINQTSLGRMLLVNRSNITGLVDRMEKAGLVARVPDPEDRRVNQVVMTEAGGQVLARAQKAYFDRIEELMSTLSAEEWKLLVGMLERVRVRLNKGR